MKKAIVFDIDDTLYDQVTPFAKVYEKLVAPKYTVSVEELFVQSRKHSDAVFELSQSGKMSVSDMYAYRIQRAFEEFGIEISREEALLFQKEYEKNQKEIVLSEEMKALLSFCYGKVTLGVISNGLSDHQWGKVETLGLTKWIPKEHIFISGDLGVAKPDTQIFQIAKERLQTDGEFYYIGDSYRNDMMGASSAGVKTIWMNRRGYLLIEGGVVPDHIISSEKELSALLKTLLT